MAGDEEQSTKARLKRFWKLARADYFAQTCDPPTATLECASSALVKFIEIACATLTQTNTQSASISKAHA